ncbi:MAG: sigma-70 family RNA polymerase sigma factor [Polyangiaceae bacterium]
MCSPEIETLVERVAQVAVVRRSLLIEVARREGLRAEDAFDVVQEGIITLLKLARLEGLEIDDSIVERRLISIVRNAARNRRRRHFLKLQHDDIDGHEPSDERPSADELIEQAETAQKLMACVQELCERQRAVVTLRMLEQRAGEDVASSLGVSTNHVAVLLHRARESLRVCMTA